MRRISELAARSGLALAGVVLAVALLEGALRLLPSARGYHVWPPNTVRTFPPVPEVFPGIDHAAHFTTNSEGIRGRELGSEEEYRILAVGGSTTESLRADDAAAWPAVVEQLLGRTADGRSTWIGNVGRGGMNSRDHVLHVDLLTAQYPTLDAVLVLLGANDLTIALAQGEHYTPPPSLSDPEARRVAIERAFAVAPNQFRDDTVEESTRGDWPSYKNTALWRLLRRTRQSLQAEPFAAAIRQHAMGENVTLWRKRRSAATVTVDRLPDLRPALADYRANLRTIAALARRRGMRLVSLTQPTIWRAGLPRAAAERCWLGGVGDFQRQESAAYYSIEALAEGMRLFNDALLDVSRELGFEAIDLASRIPKDESVFYDDAHFTEKGERLVAEAVAEEMARRPPYSR